MSEESEAKEKSETEKVWVSGPMMDKLNPLVDRRFPECLDAQTMQLLEEAQRAASQSLQNLTGPAFAAFNEINKTEAFGEVKRIIEQQSRLFQSGVNSAFLESFSIFENSNQLANIDWEAFWRDQAEGARELADRGWFISMNSPIYYHRRFLDMIRDGRWEECEREIQEHYEELLLSIRDDLTAQFPERKTILEEAFKLHNEGRFIAAIPLFLIQSDGIGESIFGMSPFSRRNDRKIFKEWLDKMVTEGDFLTEFWRSIGRILPMFEKSDKLDVYEDPLNRHNVIHGMDLTYGTKRNSLKAIAWLQYVGSFAMLDEQRSDSFST